MSRFRPKPTVYDVAERAGVSIATVSRVINGSASIRPETRDRVIAAIDDLGFVPNGSAQGLGRRSTGVIGLVYLVRHDVDPALTGSDVRRSVVARGVRSLIYYDQLIRSVEAAGYRYGYALLLSGARSYGDRELVLKLSGKCDGMVLMDQVVGDDVLAELCAMLPVACIAHQPSDVGATMVLPDNVCGIDQIVDHLVAEHRVTSLAFLSGPEGNIDADMRRDALVARAALHGVAVSPLENWRGDYGPGTAFDIARAACDRGERLPDAIVCANDASASGVVAALHDAGLSVPGDVAVTGFDDMEIASVTTPSLTTVRQPLARMANAAVGAVVRATIGGSRSSPPVTVPVSLVVRQSCGCPGDTPYPSPADEFDERPWPELATVTGACS